jgi:hypothetical protein
MAGTPRTREGLIEAIYKMVGDETWNVAPVNYTVAERAVEMTERYLRRQPGCCCGGCAL